MTTNQISYWNLQELIRSNKAREAENARTNKENENIKRDANRITESLGSINASELHRSNIVKEIETNRTNIANEAIKSAANEISRSKLAIDQYAAESGRISAYAQASNAATNASNLIELRRSNLAQENLKQQTINETVRTNIQNENIKRFSEASNAAARANQSSIGFSTLSESQRHNQAVELETKRNNLINQQLEAAGLLERTQSNAARNQAQILSNLSPNTSVRYAQ